MQNNLSVYIHFPFCKSKCPYCDFNSRSESFDEDELEKAYIRELNYFYNKTRDRKISTIFFGGGTPSLMSSKTIENIISHVVKLWGIIENKVTKDIEISIEANPTSVEMQKIKDFKSAGINRLSLGIQSLVEKDLKILGRKHSVCEAKKAIEIAQKNFGKNYSIDLIYTRPNQKISDWIIELEEAIKLSPYHVSLYQLTLEEGTKFHSMYEEGKLNLPNDDVSTEFYKETNRFMQANNFPQYEISNYAKPGSECQHNLNYWQSGEYIGIGAGAHSRVCIGNIINNNYKVRTAIEMEKNPKDWIKLVNERDIGFSEVEMLKKSEFLEEFLLMGLRLNKGIGNYEFSNYITEDLFRIINKNKLQKCIKNGLISIDKKNSSIKATRKGFLLLNTTLQKLL
ncbi:radical SAM family heme chaperone HemW [Pseudomonadota bacterium]